MTPEETDRLFDELYKVGLSQDPETAYLQMMYLHLQEMILVSGTPRKEYNRVSEPNLRAIERAVLEKPSWKL